MEATNKIRVIKKDSTYEDFNPQKIINAVKKSAFRALVVLDDEQCDQIVNAVMNKIKEMNIKDIPISEMHNIVEYSLELINPSIAKSYRDYRNYKIDFVHIMDAVYKKSQAIRYIGDKENANTDSALVATKRSLIFNELNKRLYRKFFMTVPERQACKEGYIYIHDQVARLDTMNCFDRSTRFITANGIQSFNEFSDGDEIMVPTHLGNWKKGVVHSYGWQKLQRVYFKRGNSNEKSVLVTPNHRWILKDGSETTNLKVGDKLIYTPDISSFNEETKSYQCYTNSGDRTWVVTRIEPATLNPKSKVWCLEVEDDHSFLLEGGIPTGNCCLFDAKTVLSGGFEMGNVWYNEPKTLDVAFDVIGDIILSTASQQYGGFTIPEIDKLLIPYAEKSYQLYYTEYLNIIDYDEPGNPEIPQLIHNKADKYAMKKVNREFEQGFQGIEMKLNTVGSSRGDYPFITMTFGLSTHKFGKMASITFLKVHMNGQGKEGNKKPVLFPKLVFLYDKNLHGPGCENEDVFEAGIECSSKTMYPDWLSLTGDGYVASMYKKYGAVVSPMGCRAFLSPWFERGGMNPADENDKPVFVGRFNIGAVSLHLPMILAKSRQEGKDFYEVLDYYLEMIRNIHKRTYDYIGELRASINPVAFCEGGFYGGHLDPKDKIKSILKPMTASFGITALNELQELYNGKSLVEDGEFAIEVMNYINKKINEFKEKDGYLYAIYSTPAENLCGLQVKQFRAKYGIIEGVSDKEYVSNSFHCHVSENISPIEKQDLEGRFWDLSNGGKIQYVKYPIDYNIEAIKTLIRRAMEKGFYEGANLSLAYCDDCGHQELEMDVCPKCGSKNLTKIDRMNGYLAYSRVHGDTRLNSAKMAEIADRISM